LYYAALLGLSTITRLLLKKDAEVNAQGGRYGNALQAASAGGHEQVVKMLLDKSAEINAQGGRYSSAVQAATTNGYKYVAELLLGVAHATAGSKNCADRLWLCFAKARRWFEFSINTRT
jgi:ankyrin repeat protein